MSKWDAILNMAEGAGDDVRAIGRSEGLDAVRRMADDVVDVADDWGWKGGKPGELTGGEYVKALGDIEAEALRKTKRRFNIPEEVEDYNPYGGERQKLFYETQRLNALDPYVAKADKQLSSMYESGLDTDETTVAMMSFDALEKAGIPRKWTGRVYKALGENSSPLDTLDVVEESAQAISDSMRSLTNDQRETFLALLPEWSGSLADLADAARSL